jgi:hypothetical protein
MLTVWGTEIVPLTSGVARLPRALPDVEKGREERYSGDKVKRRRSVLRFHGSSFTAGTSYL